MANRDNSTLLLGKPKLSHRVWIRKHSARYGVKVPHDSPPASGASASPEPVLLSLSVPTAAPAGLTDGLVRGAEEQSGAEQSTEAPAPVLDLSLPDERIVEFLVGVAHSDTGFIAATTSGERAVAIVAATAAALCGEDIRAALTEPDIEFLRGLGTGAVQALRDVLLAVRTSEPDAVHAALRVLAR